MKRILPSIIMSVLCLAASAQDAQKMKQYDVVIGSVTLSGEKVDGYIRAVKPFIVNGNQKGLYMWDLHREISFVEKKVFDESDEVAPGMFTKYSPKECEGFTYWDINLGNMTFQSVRMQNAAAVGVPKQGFLEKICEKNGVTFYTYYHQPSLSQEPSPETITVKDCYNKPYIMFKRDTDDKAQYVGKYNVDNEFADYPDLVTKFKNGEFTHARSHNDNKYLFKYQEYSMDEPSAKSDAYVNLLETFIDMQ